jgi:hypothetical protein
MAGLAGYLLAFCEACYASSTLECWLTIFESVICKTRAKCGTPSKDSGGKQQHQFRSSILPKHHLPPSYISCDDGKQEFVDIALKIDSTL